MTNDSAKKVQGRGRLVAILVMLVPCLACMLVACKDWQPPSRKERQAKGGGLGADGGAPPCQLCSKQSVPDKDSSITVNSDGGFEPGCLCVYKGSAVTFINKDKNINGITFASASSQVGLLPIGTVEGDKASRQFNDVGVYCLGLRYDDGRVSSDCSVPGVGDTPGNGDPANGTLEVVTSGDGDPEDKRGASR